jgi:hypothetical protein
MAERGRFLPAVEMTDVDKWGGLGEAVTRAVRPCVYWDSTVGENLSARVK